MSQHVNRRSLSVPGFRLARSNLGLAVPISLSFRSHAPSRMPRACESHGQLARPPFFGHRVLHAATELSWQRDLSLEFAAAAGGSCACGLAEFNSWKLMAYSGVPRHMVLASPTAGAIG